MNLYISSCIFLIFLLLYIPSQILCEDFPRDQIKSVENIHRKVVSSSNSNVEKIQSTQVESGSISGSNTSPTSSAQLNDDFTGKRLDEENFGKSDLSHVHSIDSLEAAPKENSAYLASKEKLAELKKAEEYQISNERNKTVLDNHDVSELLVKDIEMKNLNRNKDESGEYSHEENLTGLEKESRFTNSIPGDSEHYFRTLENTGFIISNTTGLDSIDNISYISITNDVLSDLSIHLNKSVSSRHGDHSERNHTSNAEIFKDLILKYLSDLGILISNDKKVNKAGNKNQKDSKFQAAQKERILRFAKEANLIGLEHYMTTEENTKEKIEAEKVNTEDSIPNNLSDVGIYFNDDEKENVGNNKALVDFILNTRQKEKRQKYTDQTDLIDHGIFVNLNTNMTAKEKENMKESTEAKTKERLELGVHVTTTEVTVDLGDTSKENRSENNLKSFQAGENVESNQKILNRQKTPNFTEHTDLTDLGIFLGVDTNMTAEEREIENKKLEKADREAHIIEILGDVGFHLTTTKVTFDLNDTSKGNQSQNEVENLKNFHTDKTTESILVTKKAVMAEIMHEIDEKHEYSDLPLDKDTRKEIREHEKHPKETSESETTEKNEKDAEEKQTDENVTEMDDDLSNRIISSSSYSPATNSEKQQPSTEKSQADTEKSQPSTEKSQPDTEKSQPITEMQKSTTEKHGEKLKTAKPRAKFSQTFINELFKDQEEQNQLDSKLHVNFIDYVVSQMIDYSGNETHLYLGGFDDVYKFKLQPLRSDNFLKKAFLWTETPKFIKSKHLASKLKDLGMYEGTIEHQEETSFAIGYIVDHTFMGAIMLPTGKTVYIEPVGNYQHADSVNHKKYFTYTGSQVLLSSCARLKNSGDICSEELYTDLYSCKSEDYSQVACFVGYENRHEKHRFWDEDTKFGNVSFTFNLSHIQPKQNTTCLMELVSDSGQLGSNQNESETIILRDLIIIGLHAKWIFKQLDFNNDGLPDNFNLQIGRIVLKISSPSYRANETMMQHLSKFQKHRHPMCAAVLFVSTSLKREPISTTYAGGICKSKNDEGELPTNVAVINERNPNGDTNVLFIRAMTLVKTIGQMMGSFQDCDEKMSNTAIPDYWNSFFSECEINNMARFVTSDGSCTINDSGHIYKKRRPHFQLKTLCGNQKIDPGEECDCGSPENCITENSCCIPPGKKHECRFDRSKGHECEWKDLCCTRSCNFIPKSWKFLCSVGEPSCSTETSYCNGMSSKCPSNDTVASTYDGLGCWPGPPQSDGSATCKSGFCNSTICQDNGLLDCKCTPKSGEECRVCCKKEENKMCVPIEHFGVRSKGTKLFFRRPGTVCQEVKFGYCDKRGFCISKIQMLGSTASHIYAPIFGHHGYFFTYITVAFSILSRLLFFKLFQ